MIKHYRIKALILALCIFAALAPMAAFAQSSAPQALLGSFPQPGFITSAGQTSDAAIVKVLANTRLKLGFGYEISAKPQALAGSKTLVLVLGASNKGLGAAGMSLDQEMARVKAVIAQAQKDGMKIISMHTGGTARRGEASNKIIELCAPASSIVIVVQGGNADGLFTDLCAKAGVPLVQVPSIAEAGNVLKSLMAQK